MILGKFVDNRAILPVRFYLSADTELAIDFVVDTGFNDYLTLPPQAVLAMNLDFYATGSMRLADGSSLPMSIYFAEINWDDRKLSVPVIATGTKPLLGTALLKYFRLTIDFEPDGLVQLESLQDR
jgi:clan AA aspartic protease